MSKAPIARKALAKAQKSVVSAAAAGKPPKKKKNTIIAREPRVIARERYEKDNKAKQEAEKKFVEALYAEHTRQVAKPLFDTYFMKMTNRVQKVVRECLKANNGQFIAAREDADLLFRLTFTHGQKETLQTFTLYGVVQQDDRLCVFLDEAQTMPLLSELGMPVLINFANSASHATPDTDAHLTPRQQIALYQHFMLMIAQDLQERIERVKREFPEYEILDAHVIKQYVLDALK